MSRRAKSQSNSRSGGLKSLSARLVILMIFFVMLS